MNLDGLLKSKTVTLPTLGEVTLFELPYKAQMELFKSQEADDGMTGAITVKYALQLPESVEEVAERITLAIVMEVTEALGDIIDFDVEAIGKKSESTLEEDSSSH